MAFNTVEMFSLMATLSAYQKRLADVVPGKSMQDTSLLRTLPIHPIAAVRWQSRKPTQLQPDSLPSSIKAHARPWESCRHELDMTLSWTLHLRPTRAVSYHRDSPWNVLTNISSYPRCQRQGPSDCQHQTSNF